MRILWVLGFCFFLSACMDASTNYYAPVVEVSSNESIPSNGLHIVLKGETLYEIAWRYGLDYQDLALLNHIEEPYTIWAGQRLFLSEKKTFSQSFKKAKRNLLLTQPKEKIIKIWMMPAQGKVISFFSTINKGINMIGKRGDPIYATASGEIVYCGNGLRGYGNLIIIKHNSLYLSAYAHNQRTFVREGEWVKQGQQIAEMGNTGTKQVMLHFEIRKAGKAIDPLQLVE